MATQVEPRVEVGVSDLGHVFIFHFAEKNNYTDKLERDTWQVRAGNHTVATVDSEDKANRIALALCGTERLVNGESVLIPAVSTSSADTASTLTTSTGADYVEEVRMKVSRKKDKA